MPELFALSNDVEAESPRGLYERAIVDEVWEASEVIPGNDAGLWRKDEHGSTICRSEYGNRVSSFGWEISETAPGTYQPGVPGELKALHVDNH